MMISFKVDEAWRMDSDNFLVAYQRHDKKSAILQYRNRKETINLQEERIMTNEHEIKAMAEKTGMTEEYVKSMLEFKENYEKHKEEVTPMAEALGMTAEQYISEIDRQESNLYFLTTKGFDIKTMAGLQQAKE